jgi:hypothetical protein
VNIPGVPEQIEWTDVAAFLTSLGLDLNHITRDGVAPSAGTTSPATCSPNAAGKRYLDSEPATSPSTTSASPSTTTSDDSDRPVQRVPDLVRGSHPRHE